MIYRFSGTGNSKFIAEELAVKTNDKILSITDCNPNNIVNDDTLGFVFPIYAWGVPPIVLEFINRLNISPNTKYIWAVMTCGDETGAAPDMLIEALNKKSVHLNACFSVIMPNTYILLPGFDTDPKSLEDAKIKQSTYRINKIAANINSKDNVFDVHIGSMPKLKTKIVYPLFKHMGIFTSKWNVNDNCTHCGLCVQNCPTRNISMTSESIKWGKNCVSCLSCIHRCPHKAINYGNITLKKGRYFFRFRK